MIYSCDDYRAAVACEEARLYPEDDLYYTDCEEDDEYLVIDEDLNVYASTYSESAAFDLVAERFTEEEIEELGIEIMKAKEIALWN